MTTTRKDLKKGLLALEMKRIERLRVKAGTCRHCGGRVPCWSAFGDQSVGIAHTKTSLKDMLADGRIR